MTTVMYRMYAYGNDGVTLDTIEGKGITSLIEGSIVRWDETPATALKEPYTVEIVPLYDEGGLS